MRKPPRREAVLPPCMCGCGQSVRKPGQRYLYGHSWRRVQSGYVENVEARLADTCVTACAFCDWRVEETVRAGHNAFLAHHAARHAKR